MSVYAQNDGSLSTGVVTESGTTWKPFGSTGTVAAKRVAKVSVTVSAAAASSVSDANGTILAVPASAPVGTVYQLDWPVVGGQLTVTPGAGVTLAVSFDV